MKLKKIILGIGIILLFSFCGKSENKKIKIILSDISAKEEILLSKALEGYKKKYSNLEVDVEVIKNGYTRELKIMLDEGKETDVFIAPSPIVIYLIRSAKIISLDEYINKNDLNNRKMDKYKIDNKIYGYPYLDKNKLFIIYNKDILERLGISPPKTDIEFFDMLKKIKEAKDNNLLGDKFIAPLSHNFAFLDFYSEDYTKYLLKDDDTEEINILKMLEEKNLFINSDSLQGKDKIQAFLDNEIALIIGSENTVDQLKQKSNKFNFGVSKIPNDKGTMGVAYVISSKSNYPKESAHIIKYIDKVMTGEITEFELDSNYNSFLKYFFKR